MKGGIYSEEKCPVCGGKYKDYGTYLACPSHLKCRASNFRVKFGKTTKRFKSYSDAQRFLTGLRFKTDEGTFDERDYRRENPLSFTNMSEKWKEYKKGEVKAYSYRSIRNHLDKAQIYFQNMNVREIRYGHLEDFLKSLHLSNKTKHNILSTLHSFFVWMKRRQEIREIPDFPEVSFELGYRQVIDKETQHKILDEVKRIADQKTYLGIKFLSTYISIRPNEMRTLKEGNIDLKNGYFHIPHPKEKKLKSVPILEEDVAILESFPTALPSVPFFRDEKTGQMFGQNRFYKYWKKACKNLGIEGVDLYGGTRHSSARALRKYFSPEEIKRATMHSTSAAFERYFRIEADDVRNVYKKSADIIHLKKTDEK